MTAGGKRTPRPLVVGGAGLCTSSGGQQQQLSCLTDSDEAADSHLREIIPPYSPRPRPRLPPGLLFTKRGDSSS